MHTNITITAAMLTLALMHSTTNGDETTPGTFGTAVQWTQAEGGNGNWYSFAISDSPLCWYEFADHAQSMGGELASLETEPEFDFAKQVLFNGPNLNEKIFVGLEQSPEGDASGPDQGWFWLSGAPLSFDPWDSSVDDAAGCQDVAGFRNASSPLLDDVYPCDDSDCPHGTYSTGGIVEWSADCNGDGMVDYGQILNGELTDDDGNGVPDVCEEEPIPGTFGTAVQWANNGHWYMMFTFDSEHDNATIFDAQAIANAMGWEVSAVRSGNENTWIYSNFGNTRFGAYQDMTAPDYSEPNGGWRWTNGEDWDYTAWLGGEPNNGSGNEHGAAVCCGGGWNDVRIDNGGAYLFEYDTDCNGDSIADYGQILSGELTDDDGNGVPDVCEECPGDIIEDGVVNLVDFSQFLVDFGSTGESISDLNGDLVVDLNDFSIFLVNYGNVCETRSAVAETGLGKVAPTHHIGGVPRRSMN